MTDQNGAERSSATEVLRRMLDERGVEWWQKKRHTCWKVGKGQEVEMWRAWEAPDGSITLKVDYIYHLTPEQAIDATLGRGECHDAAGKQMAFFACSACGATNEHKHPRFCYGCGRKVVTDG